MIQASMEKRAEAYLLLRRRLGAALKLQGRLLLGFARYAEGTGHRGPITTALAVRWAKLPETAAPAHWARRLQIVRAFARHEIARDPRTEVPPVRCLGPGYRRVAPHVYSDREIAELLRAAANLCPADGLRPRTYATLFGLLAATGLRVSEAIRLTQADVDLDAAVLTVSETKFHKSRLVPFHPSTRSALAAYANQRTGHHPALPATPFFLSQRGLPLTYRAVLKVFMELRRGLAWGTCGGRRAPRIHDLRHTFACRRLLAWYQEGGDINVKLPALSTYLGHARVSHTYWYLTAIPDLMALAAARFEGGGAGPA